MQSPPPQQPAPPKPAWVEALLKELFDSGAPRLVRERVIGRGGIGAVSVAVDTALCRRVAMKTLHTRTYSEEVLVRGFIREAQITGQLGHPNIVPVYDVGVDEADGELYFTMKMVEGRGLNKLISRRREQDDLGYDYERMVNLIEILLKVCDALAFAHSRGVLHCDIKSENVMVGDFGEVYLMDWGGAMLLRPREGVDQGRWVQGILPELPGQSTEGLVFGTPAYMAPEQAHGRRSAMDERSDVFALGAILYEILSGRAPFRAPTTLEALRRAQRYELDPLESIVDRALVPRELVRITMKALARRPEERYPSVEALKQELVRVLRGAGSFPTVRFAKGSMIIREGEVGDAAYSVVTGAVEAFREGEGGERVSLRVMGPGDVFGEAAIFASAPRSASVVALTETTLVVVTGDVIEQEMGAMKPWMGAFIRALASRFASAEARARRSSPAPTPPAAQARSAAQARPAEAALPSSRLFSGVSEESLMIELEEPGGADEGTELHAAASEEREVTALGSASEGSPEASVAVVLESDEDEPEIDVDF